MDAVQQIAQTVLYEGYVLWPYRRSTIKNQQRWTFGGVYPRAFSDAQRGSDPWCVQTECLVRGAAPVLDVTVRFLQLVERRVGRRTLDGSLDLVDELRLGGERYLTWEEATEREELLTGLALQALLHRDVQVALHVSAGSATEPLVGPGGVVAGALVREWAALDGTVEVAAHVVADSVFRVTVRIRNTSDWIGTGRESALRHSFLSAHAVLQVADGSFVSLTDPPPALRHATDDCENVKLWPVLVGTDGDTHTMLAAPIILYDYPRIAPESAGDLFDATEIDQLLLLNVLTLTDEEKSEMRAADPRTRQILERSESFTQDDFLRLHGTFRDIRQVGDDVASPLAVPTLSELETPGPESVLVNGTEIRPGSQVRLCPRTGGDIMDIALADQIACVEAIEQDYEGTLHLAVTLRDDPGRDLGRERQIGHRFFFAPDEVDPVAEGLPGDT